MRVFLRILPFNLLNEFAWLNFVSGKCGNVYPDTRGMKFFFGKERGFQEKPLGPG